MQGRYFFPLSARCVPAEARRSDDGQSVEILDADGTMLATVPKAGLRASARLGVIRRRLSFADGGSFETDDNDAVDALLGHQSLLHRLESSWRMVLASIVFAAAAALLFALYGVPATAYWLAGHTPARVARFASDETLATLDQGALRPTRLPPAQQDKYRALFAQVALKARGGPGAYRLLFRNAPEIGPNAFALPDGAIVATDQIFALVHNDDEIEGVFAHEMSHVDHAHGLQRIYQASLVPGAIAFVTGDATQMGHLASILPGLLLQSAYSRQFEQQADDDAAALLRRMGKNPGHLADLLERMEKKICGTGDCGPSWLGSHPTTAARAARLRQS